MYLYWIVIVGLTAFAAFAVGVLWASYAQKEALAGQWEDLRRERADLLHAMVQFELVKREAEEAPTRDDEVLRLFEPSRIVKMDPVPWGKPGAVVKVDEVRPGESIWNAAERERWGKTPYEETLRAMGAKPWEATVRPEKADSTPKSGNPDAEDRAGSTGEAQVEAQDGRISMMFCHPCNARHPRNRFGEDNQCQWYRTVGSPMRERERPRCPDRCAHVVGKARAENERVWIDVQCVDCGGKYIVEHGTDDAPMPLDTGGSWPAGVRHENVNISGATEASTLADLEAKEGRQATSEERRLIARLFRPLDTTVQDFVDEVKRADSPMERAMRRFEEMGMPPDDAPAVEYRSIEEAEAVHGPVVETFEPMSREADQADELAFALAERARLDPDAPTTIVLDGMRFEAQGTTDAPIDGYIVTGIDGPMPATWCSICNAYHDGITPDRVVCNGYHDGIEVRGACRHCGAVTTHATGCPDEGGASRC